MTASSGVLLGIGVEDGILSLAHVLDPPNLEFLALKVGVWAPVKTSKASFPQTL